VGEAARDIKEQKRTFADLCAELTPDAAGEEGLALVVASTRRGEGRSTIAASPW